MLVVSSEKKDADQRCSFSFQEIDLSHDKDPAAVAEEAKHLHQLSPGASKGCTPSRRCWRNALEQLGAQFFLGFTTKLWPCYGHACNNQHKRTCQFLWRLAFLGQVPNTKFQPSLIFLAGLQVAQAVLPTPHWRTFFPSQPTGWTGGLTGKPSKSSGLFSWRNSNLTEWTRKQKLILGPLVSVWKNLGNTWLPKSFGNIKCFASISIARQTTAKGKEPQQGGSKAASFPCQSLQIASLMIWWLYFFSFWNAAGKRTQTI